MVHKIRVTLAMEGASQSLAGELCVMTAIEITHAHTPVLERKSPFWRRLFNSIIEGRQRRADKFVQEYLRVHDEYHVKGDPTLLSSTEDVSPKRPARKFAS